MAGVVWSPGLELSPSLPITDLEVKLCSLITLLVLTLISGLSPLFLFRRQGSGDIPGPRGLSLISCFSGGVFLATCLLDLLPDYLSDINEALSQLAMTLQFPLREFILAMGFFLVLTLEQIALSYRDAPVSSEDTHPLLGAEPRHPDHPHADVGAHSPVRAVALVASLSLHALLEGLGVGLLRDGGGGKVLDRCVALLLRNCVLAFCLTVKLGQGRPRPRALLGCLLLFSFMSPLGVGVGVALNDSSDPLHRLARAALEGVAAGAFFYVTFLEILPHDLAPAGRRILRVIVMLFGFSVVTSVLFIKI
ncbi:zinc transporter ZIP1 [Gastrophryne carolinensis]